MDATPAAAAKRVAAYQQLAMVNFAKLVLPTEAEVHAVLQAAAPGPQPAAALVLAIAPTRQAQVFRALAWLVKLGILKVNG